MIARGHIDEVRFVDPLARKMDAAGTGRVPEGSSVYLRGWAFLTGPPRAAGAAFTTIDERETFELAYNQPRPDVVRVLGLPPILPIGFHGVHSLSTLACGPHILRVALIDGATNEPVAIDASIAFEIVDGALMFPATERVAAGEMTVTVDTFSASGRRGGFDAAERPLERGAVVVLRGWAVDRRFGTAASDVYAFVDATTPIRGVIGTMRADVAGGIGLQTVARCGYVVRIPTESLAAGRHVVEIRAIAADGERYAAGDKLAFVIAE